MCKVKSSSNGAVFMLTAPHNPCGDVYWLFREDSEDVEGAKEKLVLVVIQCKDWFDSSPQQKRDGSEDGGKGRRASSTR